MKLNYRVILFSLGVILGLTFALPSLLQTDDGKKITLGLDLQGGLHLLLGVKTEEAVKSKIKSVAASIKHYTDKKDILIDNLSFNKNEITFSVVDADEVHFLKEFLSYKGLHLESINSSFKVSLLDKEILKTEKEAIKQAIETIRNRLNQFGLAEPVVAKQGEDKILVQIAGIKTPEEEQRARSLISKTAKLEIMAVDEQRISRVNRMSRIDAASYGDVILPSSNNENYKFLLKEIPILDGGMLTNAVVGFNKNNQPIINFTLNAEGAEIFGDFTGSNVGNRLAVVLDGKVYTAPVINERIGGGSGQISGDYTVMQAKDLAIALRSGALLAPVFVMEKRSVGPSLGADSIRSSLIALISGFILVIVFMVVYYRLAGLIANIALISNLIIILGVMSLFGATLTLPGMAGIVLTVGMAVDSNVIISERIREFLYEGKNIQKAIEDGYSNAMSAILDANITTLIAAIVLYAYGTGAIKGFAITISIGIIASMLTAIIGTHGIYQMLESKIAKSKNNHLWFGIKG